MSAATVVLAVLLALATLGAIAHLIQTDRERRS